MKKIYNKIFTSIFIFFIIIILNKVDFAANDKDPTFEDGTITVNSNLFELSAQSNNGKRDLICMYINQEGRIVVVWEDELKGYKPEQSLNINGEDYTAEEIGQHYASLTILDSSGNTLLSYNDSLKYYVVQTLHETQKMKDGFEVTILTSAGGHNLTGVVYYVDKEDNNIIVYHNYKGSSADAGELDFDFDQSIVKGLVVGNTYSFYPRENNGYSFVNAVVTFGNGTTQTFTDKNFSITAVSGATTVTYNYGKGYRVEYYYDNVLDSTLTEFNYVSNGTVISTYTDKPKEGFTFDHAAPTSITMSDTLTDPCIRVYYNSNGGSGEPENPTINKYTLSFKHLTAGDILDPTKKYSYEITYFEDGVQKTTTCNLSNNETFNLNIDENTEYKIKLTSPITIEDLIYNGSSNFTISTITGTIGTSNKNEELRILGNAAVQTGITDDMPIFVIMLMVSVILFIYFKNTLNSKRKYI